MACFVEGINFTLLLEIKPRLQQGPNYDCKLFSMFLAEKCGDFALKVGAVGGYNSSLVDVASMFVIICLLSRLPRMESCWLPKIWTGVRNRKKMYPRQECEMKCSHPTPSPFPGADLVVIMNCSY